MGKRFGHIISNQRLFPFLSWLPDINSSTTRPDLEAGFVSAILILPQAVALATLAGMPPEYGIYTSIIPVIIASVWGSSWHTLSGPNTAVCVLIAFSVAPFASVGTDEYIGYVLSLTLMAGLIQLATGWLKLGALLDFISYTVISAIILAVALIILDKVQEARRSSFRFPVLAVAVGVYLPLGLSVPIFIGGLIAYVVGRKSATATAEVRQARENSGLLVASGLITGEALMGVFISVAAVILANSGSGLPGPIGVAPILGVIALVLVIIYQYRKTMNSA